MELRQLRYFVAVAEDLHFGKAARRLNITQPPLSQQIRQLEEELGAKLLERTSRSVALTREGEYFLDEARAVLRRAQDAARTVGAMARGETGSLSVGFVAVTTQTPFPCAVRGFRQAYPGVSMSLREMSTNDQFRGLETRDLDLGIIRHFGHDLTGYGSMTFLREPYVWAVPQSHHLARRKAISVKDLRGEPLVMFTRCFQPDLYDTIMACFRKAGVCPDIAQETNRRTTALALIAAGMGISPIPASMMKLAREKVVYRPVAGDFPYVELRAIWPEEGAAPSVKAFVRHLRDNRRLDLGPGGAPNAGGSCGGGCTRGGSSEN